MIRADVNGIDQDKLDAARYRWLRENREVIAEEVGAEEFIRSNPDDFDKIVDASMANP